MFSFLKRSRKPSPAARKSVTFRPTMDALEDRVVLSTFYVTSTADSSSVGTLRWAVGEANYDSSRGVSDTIVFAKSLSGSTIKLKYGALELKAVKGLAGVTVDGGSAVTIDGGSVYEAFFIDHGANVQLKNLTVKNGYAYQGGAASNHGSLNVYNCTLTGNQAAYGGALYNAAGANLYLYNSTLSSNSATQNGGGLDNDGTVLAYNDSFVKNNANYGGGIANFGDLEAVENCYFASNRVGFSGGALYNGGQATIGNGWFTSNQAYYGGAIADFGSLNMGGTTFHYNSAVYHGAAIYVGHGHKSTFHESKDSYAGNSAPDHYDIWFA
jgi:predicted outer membrane repeat protein